jgi:CubicO group peptidase (beta-lactamase class C family)
MDVLDQVAAWPVEAAAVGVVRWDPDDPAGADALQTTGPVDRRFDWASVTKPATALAVLVAVEEGTLALDDPAGPPGASVRHLLSHASGLGPDPGPAVAPPGVRRIYSNTGFGALAELLEARAGMPFSDYLTEGVLGPLGMRGATLAPSPSGPAAAGLRGTLLDLVALARAWARPTLVSPATWRNATAVQFEGLAGVLPGFGPYHPCDWGLGVEVKGRKRPHWTGATNAPTTVGHFGQSGSFFWVDPVAGVLCCGLADRPFGAWAARVWPALAEALLAEATTAGPRLGSAP